MAVPYIRADDTPEVLRNAGRWCMAEATRKEKRLSFEDLCHREMGKVDAEILVPAAYQEWLVDSFGVLPRKTKEDCHAFLSWCATKWGDAAAPGPNHWYGIYRHAVGHFHVAKRTRIKAYRKYLPHRANVQNPWKYLLAIMFQDHSCFDDWLLRHNRQARQVVPSEETI